MKYKALIFDMDGTLLDTLEDLCNSVNRALAMYGCETCTTDHIRQSLGFGVDELIARCTQGGRDNPNYANILNEHKSYYQSHSEIKTKPYAGICELITNLEKSGVKVAVVSNKVHEALVPLVEKFFPSIQYICGERMKEGIQCKPHPDMVFRITGELDVLPGECAYVGDSEVDIQTANNSGMDCISVDWGFRDRYQLIEYNPTVIVSHPDEIFAFIN